LVKQNGGPGRGQGRKSGSKASVKRKDAYGDKVIQIPVTPETGDAIRQYCERAGISRQAFFRAAAIEYLLNH
jgi:hypothetical protein